MTRTPPLPIPKFLTEDWKYVLYSSWLDDCWCSVLMFPLSCHWNLLEWLLGQWAHHRETDQFWSSQATIKEKQKTKHKAQNKWELLRNVPQIQVRCKNCVRATVVRWNMRGLNMQVCTHNIPALKQIYTYCLISSIKKGSYFKKKHIHSDKIVQSHKENLMYWAAVFSTIHLAVEKEDHMDTILNSHKIYVDNITVHLVIYKDWLQITVKNRVLCNLMGSVSFMYRVFLNVITDTKIRTAYF